MNERQWWSRHVQPRLHKPAKNQLFWKFQDAFIKGRPDVLFSLPPTYMDHPYVLDQSNKGLAGFIELKYDPAWPKRFDTKVDVGLTAEQFRHLAMWYASTKDHRTALVLYGVGKMWWLFRHDAAVLQPGTKWLPETITAASELQGDDYASLETIPNSLIHRDPFMR